MEHVAFFRNMNLGHAGSPDRVELLDAFTAAGARSARSFQTNGTVVFASEAPGATAQHARDLLGRRPDDAVFVRDAARIAELVAGFPPSAPESDHYRELVVFSDAPPRTAPRTGNRSAAIAVPLTSADALAQIIRIDHDAVLGRIWKPKTTAGNLTALVEHALGTPGTSRTLGTLERLCRTFSPASEALQP